MWHLPMSDWFQLKLKEAKFPKQKVKCALPVLFQTYTPFTRALVSGPARAGSVSTVCVNAGRAVPAQLGISSQASTGWLMSSTSCIRIACWKQAAHAHLVQIVWSKTETLCLIQLWSDQDEQEV